MPRSAPNIVLLIKKVTVSDNVIKCENKMDADYVLEFKILEQIVQTSEDW